MVLTKDDNEEKLIGKKLYDYQHGAIDRIFDRINENPQTIIYFINFRLEVEKLLFFLKLHEDILRKITIRYLFLRTVLN